MKKVISIIIIIFVFFLFPSNSLALVLGRSTQSATTRAVRKQELQQRIEEKKLLRQQKLEEVRSRIQEKRATRAAKLADARKIRIRALFARISERFEAAISRLTKLTDRINSRIAIIEANEDLSLDLVEEQIEGVDALLTEAQASLEALNLSLNLALESEDPKQAFEVIKDSTKEIKGTLVEVHSILVHVIGDIKGLRVGQNENNNSLTPTVQPTPVPSVTQIPSGG